MLNFHNIFNYLIIIFQDFQFLEKNLENRIFDKKYKDRF